MTCPKCRSAVRIKNGHARGLQRYKCKDCGCNYTHSSMSRTPIDKRIRCIRLYLEGVGFRGISRLTGVTHTTVMRWVEKLGDDIEKFREDTDEVEPVSIMELDEMWHFIQKKHKNAGSG
jgi:transposase-like protein